MTVTTKLAHINARKLNVLCSANFMTKRETFSRPKFKLMARLECFNLGSSSLKTLNEEL